ncbi:glycosyl hydrolase family 61-domain-containing protein [Coniochaeta sp. 2T2.1]|nr:glycosyl hydrolase family 61-domain-containing protein [Coniochaeta sp. 2T2.1]
MRTDYVAALATLWASHASAHAIFQDLWVDGVDMGSQCARLPQSNSPVTNVASNDVRCNAGTSPVGKKCAVAAGSTVTVEMHQQPGDRSCGSEAIGGAHYGPVLVYMSKVSDASTADGSAGWFKVFQDTWAKKSGGGSGDDDYWGVKDLNACCGKMNVKIPSDLAPGDYLLRAEVIALHTAGSSGGAQFYMTCFQLTVTGSGSAAPAAVSFPGAYRASDPGILVNIHSALSTYVAPGPAVYAGGSTKVAGSACSGCESTCKVGSGPVGTASSVPTKTTAAGGGPATTAPSGGGSCSVQKYGQCGGTGYTGCTSCASGSVCSAVSPPYYSQCV